MAKQLHILLADDDEDDRFLFTKALEEISISTRLTTVENGEELMCFLSKSFKELPDVLFLDLNMPRKNGSECLEEIKLNSKLKHLPVIIYSTSFQENMADLLYNSGAYYYIRKTDMKELQKTLHYLFTLIVEKRIDRPTRDQFVLNLVGVA